MGRQREPRLTVLFGAIVGFLILGVGGRVAMAGVALVFGSDPNLGLRGALEWLLAGGILGAAGALLLILLRRADSASTAMQGIVVGAVLFFFSLAFSWFGGKLALRVELAATLPVAAAVYLLYGVVLERVTR